MITPRGTLVLVASIVALVLAAAINHLALALFGVAGLAWMLAGVLTVSRAGVAVDREAKTTYLQEGTPVEAGYRIRSTSGHQHIEARQRLPQGVDLHGDARVEGLLDPEEGLEANFELEIPIRGLYHLPPVEVRTSDPFGLIEEDLEVETASLSFTVTPRRETPREPVGRPRYTTPRPGEYMSSNAGSGMEFYSIRQYQPSDPLRLVNWKASAQKDELMVNEFHDERVTQTVALVDHRRATGLGVFEAAPLHEVARAAALVYDGAFQGGDRFAAMLLGQAPEVLQGDGGRAFTNRWMTRLAELEPQGDCPIRFAVQENLHAIQQGAKVVVISPLCYEGDKDGVMTLLARDCAVTVLVPTVPEPLNEEQQAWKATHEANVRALRGMDVHVVETPLGVLQHAMGEGVHV